MLETATQERQASAEAFEGNLLLSTFSPEYRALLETSAEVVQLEVGERSGQDDGRVHGARV